MDSEDDLGPMMFDPVLAWLSSTPAASFAAAALAFVIPGSMCRARGRSLRKLTTLLEESARRGRLMPLFPLDSASADINHLAAALNRAGRSIDRMETALQRAYSDVVETMARALDARDAYTAGHSVRVGAYARSIALAMGLPPSEAESIRFASELHDIGKIGVPDAVLQKPGRLTDEEFGLIKLHPQIGRRILERIGQFEALLPIIELHHENFDGTGYPYRLTGDQIPLAARIVRVADSFDAMTTSRAYRGALSRAHALGEIQKGAGVQYDPEVAAAFLRLIGEGKHHEMLAAGAELLRMEVDPFAVRGDAEGSAEDAFEDYRHKRALAMQAGDGALVRDAK